MRDLCHVPGLFCSSLWAQQLPGDFGFTAASSVQSGMSQSQGWSWCSWRSRAVQLAMLSCARCHPLSPPCSRRKTRYQSAPRNIYRHIVLSEVKEAMAALPLVRALTGHRQWWHSHPCCTCDTGHVLNCSHQQKTST